MAKGEVKMAVDPFRVLRAALAKTKRHLRLKSIISIDYDEESDILYVKFSQKPLKDTSPLDQDGMILASLDRRGEVAGLMVMEASRLNTSN